MRHEAAKLCKTKWQHCIEKQILLQNLFSEHINAANKKKDVMDNIVEITADLDGCQICFMSLCRYFFTLTS